MSTSAKPSLVVRRNPWMAFMLAAICSRAAAMTMASIFTGVWGMASYSLSFLPGDRNQWRFARILSRNKGDLVGWFEEEQGVAKYGVWKNNGDYNTTCFDKIAEISVNDNCIPFGVRYIDVDGDGLDDFICISPNGDVFVSINEGNGNAAFYTHWASL